MIKKIIAITIILLTSITVNAQTPTRSQLQVCSNGKLAVNCSYFDNKPDSQSDIPNPRLTTPTRSRTTTTNSPSDYRIGSNSNFGSNSRVIPDYPSILSTSTNTVKVSKACIKSIFNRCPATNKPITPIKPKPTTNSATNSACSISTSRTTLGSNLTNIQPKTPVNSNSNTTSNLGISNSTRIPTSTQRPTSQNLRNCPTNTTAKPSCVKALTTSGKTTVCFSLLLLSSRPSVLGDLTWYTWRPQDCDGCAGTGMTANGTSMKDTEERKISTGAIITKSNHPLGIKVVYADKKDQFMLIRKSESNIKSDKSNTSYVCVKINDTGSFHGNTKRIADLSLDAITRVGGAGAKKQGIIGGITAWNGAGICK